jgi:hypothetical protein
LAEELHELADQERIPTLKHRVLSPCQRIFKAIESRHNSVNNFFKQLLAIGLEDFMEIFFGKVFFITVFISNVSFNVVVNGRGRSVGDVKVFSSISGWL